MNKSVRRKENPKTVIISLIFVMVLIVFFPLLVQGKTSNGGITDMQVVVVGDSLGNPSLNFYYSEGAEINLVQIPEDSIDFNCNIYFEKNQALAVQNTSIYGCYSFVFLLNDDSDSSIQMYQVVFPKEEFDNDLVTGKFYEDDLGVFVFIGILSTGEIREFTSNDGAVTWNSTC